jgi:hypothetical protein
MAVCPRTKRPIPLGAGLFMSAAPEVRLRPRTLSTWRKAEREIIRATAQREAVDLAIEAAGLADEGAAQERAERPYDETGNLITSQASHPPRTVPRGFVTSAS